MVTLNVDGVETEALDGATILDAVRKMGAAIPTLCHDERLRPFASCWLCVVEVEGARGFVPACSTKIANGMKVRTKSDRITLARKMCLDLLLSNHYGDCMAPCRLECPARVDIQGYVSLIAVGQPDAAVELMMERLPMPASIGRICPHPCETACRRNLVDEPVSICNLKRFAADNGGAGRTPKKPEPSASSSSSKKVAVVGGGPSGLSAAYYLAGLGHSVTIFEAMPKLGGMLRYGIPEYRLPKKILDSEIYHIVSSGAIDVRTGKSMGRDFSLDDLTGRRGFDAVFLAIGAWGDRSLGVEGEKSEGVISGIAFLRDVAEGRPMDFSGKKVAVVGGGNTAMDAARTAVRLGASEVSIVYRRSRDEMPACKSEIAEAEHEGVRMRLLEAPNRVLSDGGGRVKGLECTRMVLGECDSSGRRKPEPVAGSEFTIPLDYVIAAIGQKTAMAGNPQGLKLDSRSGSLCVDEMSLGTSVAGVFGGGDAVSGGGMAAEAIADGRKAALSIHRHLSGGLSAPIIEEELISVSSKKDLIKPEELSDVPKAKRAVMPTLKERMNFEEVDLGFGREQAISEALRCMSCGCDDLTGCALRKHAIEYGSGGGEFGWGEMKKYAKDTRHPFIKKEQGKCILCGRCVRICDEVMGLDSVTFARRGFDAIISTAFEGRLQDTNCVSCGQCVGTCPTGALSENFALQDFNGLQRSGPWPGLERKSGSICPYCGVGCAIDLHVLNGPTASYAVKVTSSGGPANPHGNLCVKGRFGFSFVNSAERLRKPLVRDVKGGKLREAGWDEAISIVAKKLKMAKPAEASMFVSQRCTNEEASLADALFASAFGPERNTGSFFFSGGESVRKFDMEKLELADLVVACGNMAELKRKYPVIFIRAKSARFVPAEGAETLLEASKNPVLLLEGNDPAAGLAVESFTKLGRDDCILALHENCNSVGVGSAVGGRGEELLGMLLDGGKTKAAYVLGEDPVGCAVDADHKERVRGALDSLDFLVVQDMFMTETAGLADVVLPASSFAETEGTFTNSAGLTQKLNKAMEPPSGMENRDILMAIGSAMGVGGIDTATAAPTRRPADGGKMTMTFSNGCDHVDMAFERKIRELGLIHPEIEKP